VKTLIVRLHLDLDEDPASEDAMFNDITGSIEGEGVCCDGKVLGVIDAAEVVEYEGRAL